MLIIFALLTLKVDDIWVVHESMPYPSAPSESRLPPGIAIIKFNKQASKSWEVRIGISIDASLQCREHRSVIVFGWSIKKNIRNNSSYVVDEGA